MANNFLIKKDTEDQEKEQRLKSYQIRAEAEKIANEHKIKLCRDLELVITTRLENIFTQFYKEMAKLDKKLSKIPFNAKIKLVFEKSSADIWINEEIEILIDDESGHVFNSELELFAQKRNSKDYNGFSTESMKIPSDNKISEAITFMGSNIEKMANHYLLSKQNMESDLKLVNTFLQSINKLSLPHLRKWSFAEIQAELKKSDLDISASKKY